MVCGHEYMNMVPPTYRSFDAYGNMNTHPGIEIASPPPPPPIAAFLFLPDVKIAMSPLVLFIISMV